MLISNTRQLTLEDLFEKCFSDQLPFVSYKLPGADQPETLIQQSPEIKEVSPDENFLNKSGFIIQPSATQTHLPSVLISPDIYFRGITVEEEKLPDVFSQKSVSWNQPHTNGKKDSPHYANKTEFCEGVTGITREIKKGKLTKAILSRIHSHTISPGFSPVGVFEKLCSYKDAFVYLFNIPKIGCWIGATPEKLISIDDKTLTTVSLAGTKRNDGQQVQWGQKERYEQQLVTDHIEDVLKRFSNEVKISGPTTVAAGSVVHLKTTFTATLDSKTVLPGLIHTLHPTPAIVGTPRTKALELIGKLEQHDRKYYTGFLGPVNINGATHLFVNLRCFEVLKDRINIYVGNGITKDSDPEKEWDETVHKTQTILNHID